MGQALKDRVMLAVNREQFGPVLPDNLHEKVPDMTSASLFAKRMLCAKRAAARVGKRPAAPTIAATTTSASGRGRNVLQCAGTQKQFGRHAGFTKAHEALHKAARLKHCVARGNRLQILTSASRL